VAPEQVGELGRVVESHRASHIDYRLVAGTQLGCGRFYAQTHQVVAEGGALFPSEGPAECEGGHIAQTGYVEGDNFFMNVLLQVWQCRRRAG